MTNAPRLTQAHSHQIGDARCHDGKLAATYYIWEHDSLPARVARVKDAGFADGDPRWVRGYPVDVVGTSPVGAKTDESDVGSANSGLHEQEAQWAANWHALSTPAGRAAQAALDAYTAAYSDAIRNVVEMLALAQGSDHSACGLYLSDPDDGRGVAFRECIALYLSHIGQKSGGDVLREGADMYAKALGFPPAIIDEALAVWNRVEALWSSEGSAV